MRYSEILSDPRYLRLVPVPGAVLAVALMYAQGFLVSVLFVIALAGAVFWLRRPQPDALLIDPQVYPGRRVLWMGLLIQIISLPVSYFLSSCIWGILESDYCGSAQYALDNSAVSWVVEYLLVESRNEIPTEAGIHSAKAIIHFFVIVTFLFSSHFVLFVAFCAKDLDLSAHRMISQLPIFYVRRLARKKQVHVKTLYAKLMVFYTMLYIFMQFGVVMMINSYQFFPMFLPEPLTIFFLSFSYFTVFLGFHVFHKFLITAFALILERDDLE